MFGKLALLLLLLLATAHAGRIHRAVHLNDIPRFRKLLNTTTISHNDLLIYCAGHSDNPRFVQDLVAGGADVHAGGNMPLVNAVIAGNHKVIRALLWRGADPARRAHDTGTTPMWEIRDVRSAELLAPNTTYLPISQITDPWILQVMLRHGADANKYPVGVWPLVDADTQRLLHHHGRDTVGEAILALAVMTTLLAFLPLMCV